jgi:broad specificity phosphatase PhoE
VPLDDAGRTQLAQCGAIPRDLRWAAAHGGYVSSPLVPARADMEIMLSTIDLPAAAYGIDPRLAEISFSDWEGLTYRR